MQKSLLEKTIIEMDILMGLFY